MLLLNSHLSTLCFCICSGIIFNTVEVIIVEKQCTSEYSHLLLSDKLLCMINNSCILCDHEK